MKTINQLSEADLGKTFNTPLEPDGGCGVLCMHPDGYLYLQCSTSEEWDLRLDSDIFVQEVDQPLDYIEPWWKRIGCMREQKAMTGEEAAMCDEIKELREALTPDPDAIDYKELLKKYMKLIVACEGITFVGHIGNYSDSPEFSEKEITELMELALDINDEYRDD